MGLWFSLVERKKKRPSWKGISLSAETDLVMLKEINHGECWMSHTVQPKELESWTFV